MAANACSGWNNSECEGTTHCPPRCPRFVDDEGVPALIRPYDPDHRDALSELYDAIDDSTMGLPPERRDNRERWIDRLLNQGWNLIATVDDRVAGHIVVAPADTVDPEFVVFVRPGFRDRGIGTELLKQVLAYAGDRDHDELNLNVSTKRHRAIAVYEKVGFNVTDVRRMDLEMHLLLEESLVTAARLPPAARD